LRSLKEQPKMVCTLSGYHKRTIFSVDWSHNDKIASGCADDAIRIFEQDTNVDSNDNNFPSFMLCATQEKAHSADINCVTWSTTNPNILASAGDDYLIKIWEFVKE